ncbi:hypothetical protein Ancab_023102 [Ancistrocladus abbreviatus]
MATKTLTVHPHSPHPSSLVTSITTILQALNLQNPCHRPFPNPSPLSSFSSHLTHNLVMEVIKNQTNPFHSLFFFTWASNPSPNPINYYHNFHCYNAMLDCLLSHHLFSTASKFLETHRKVCDFTVAKLIKACGDIGDIRGAIHWFHRAKLVESGGCLFSYNSILGVLVRANKVSFARALFDQIFKEGVVNANVSTYTTMIRGYCKMGMVEDARKLFHEMPCRPNLVTYNTIVHGLCTKGLVEDAREIIDRMVVSKDPLPNTVTYTTLIDGYCKKGEAEEAIECMEEMMKRNCEPNLLTYNAIVNGLCLIGRVDDAKRMMTKMRLNGLKDDIATHTSLLRGLCIIGKPEEATKHLRDMISSGMKLDVKAFGLVVNEYCKVGKPNEAISILKEMKARGIDSNVSSFNAVLRILTEQGDFDRAVLLLKQMSEMGCFPNFLSYFTVISGLCRTRGRIQELEELLYDMLQKGHEPDASLYSCLTKRYCEDDNEEMAIRVFCDAVNMGHVVDLESFTALIEQLCAKGKMHEAEILFEEMYKRCPVLHLENYRKVINDQVLQYTGSVIEDTQ